MEKMLGREKARLLQKSCKNLSVRLTTGLIHSPLCNTSPAILVYPGFGSAPIAARHDHLHPA